MKEFNWREGINARLTHRLCGYLRAVENIKKAVAKNIPAVNADDRSTWELLQIEMAKQRWF